MMWRDGYELTPDEVGRQIQDLMCERYVAPDYLRLFQELFEAQYLAESRLRAEDIYPCVSKDEAEQRIRRGLPVIDIDKLQLGGNEFDNLAGKIGEILAKHELDEHSAIRGISQAESSGEISLRELVLKVIADEEYLGQASKRIGRDEEDALFFLAAVLIAPFLRVCARPIRQKVDLNLVLTQRCPVCGGVPIMAKLRASDGKRLFECSLCNTQWAYKRLRCPFCGNEDQASLGFFFTQKEGAYRIDKCDKCRSYIKTVDERKIAGDKLRPLLVEDVATLYLDILAEKVGYHSIKGLPWKEEKI